MAANRRLIGQSDAVEYWQPPIREVNHLYGKSAQPDRHLARAGNSMPTNKRAHENDVCPSPKSRPFALQAVLVGIGIALVPLAGVGILWLKKFTGKSVFPSDRTIW